MLKSPLQDKLAKLTMPIFVEISLVMLLGSVDTFMLSRYSDNTVAAVGVVNQILTLVFLLFNVTSLGGSVLCAQSVGANDRKGFIQTAIVSILMNTALGVVISVVLFGYGRELLVMMDLRPELMVDAESYIQIVGGFAFFQAVASTLSAILRSSGKPQYSMYVTVFANLFNILGNYTLIFGHFGFAAMGAEGAAISTSISRFIAMILLLWIFKKKVMPHIPLLYVVPFPFVRFKEVLRIGIPTAGEQISYSSSQVVITYMVNMMGNEALAARTYAMNIAMISYLFSMAVAHGTSILVGQFVGARKRTAAYIVCLNSLKWALIISGFFAGCVALCGESIGRFLTSNPEIVSMLAVVLIIDIFVELGRAANLVVIFSLRSASDIHFPVIIGVCTMWFFAVGSSYLLGITLGLGLVGVWIGFALDECIRGVIMYKRWKRRKWGRTILPPTESAVETTQPIPTETAPSVSLHSAVQTGS